MPINEEELEGLSEEERAALEEEEDTGLDDDLDEDPEEELENEDPEEDEDPTDDATEETDDDADPEAEEEEEPDKTQAPDEFTPQYQADPVEGYEEKMQAIAERKRELRQQYRDGDLDLDEYEDQRDSIEDEALQLREANLKATMAAEQSQQAGAQRWQWEQDRFFGKKENKAYLDDPLIGSAFNTAVKALGADEANAGQSMAWFLEEADRMTRQRFNVPGTADKPTGKKQRKAADRSKVPPNLGDLPAAEVADTGGDEFRKLENLDGMELEQALSKMSQAEQDRYLKG